MDHDFEEIRQALLQLVGLKLSVARRALDMRVLHFGKLRRAPEPPACIKNRERGTIGEFALHIQCPWRIETSTGIVTGRGDLSCPLEHTMRQEEFSYDTWSYSKDGNLQDALVDHFMENADDLVVKAVDCRPHGTFSLEFGDGCRLAVFPNGSSDEDWRLFRPDTAKNHFVVSGGMIQR